MQIRQPASQPDVGWTKHVISLDVFSTFSRMPRTECYFSEPFSIIVGAHKLPRKFRNCDRGDHFLQKHRFHFTFFFDFFEEVSSGIQVFERNFTFSRARADALARKLGRRRVGRRVVANAPEETRWSRRGGAQTRGWGRVVADALARRTRWLQTRWQRRVVAQTRWRRRVGGDALE